MTVIARRELDNIKRSRYIDTPQISRLKKSPSPKSIKNN